MRSNAGVEAGSDAQEECVPGCEEDDDCVKRCEEERTWVGEHRTSSSNSFLIYIAHKPPQKPLFTRARPCFCQTQEATHEMEALGVRPGPLRYPNVDDWESSIELVGQSTFRSKFPCKQVCPTNSIEFSKI